MKKLIIEITHTDRSGLLEALNQIKNANLQPGEFRSVRKNYSAVGYLHTENIYSTQVINGQVHHIVKSKMDSIP